MVGSSVRCKLWPHMWLLVQINCWKNFLDKVIKKWRLLVTTTNIFKGSLVHKGNHENVSGLLKQMLLGNKWNIQFGDAFIKMIKHIILLQCFAKKMMEYKFDFSVPPELDGQQMREQWSLHTHTQTHYRNRIKLEGRSHKHKTPERLFDSEVFTLLTATVQSTHNPLQVYSQHWCVDP